MADFPHRIDLLRQMPHGTIGAELGVFAGDFTEEVTEAIRPALLFAVDQWTGTHTSGDVNGENHRTLDLGLQRQELTERWRGNLPIKIVQAESAAWLWSQPHASLDWVYIDTRHTYEQCAHELAAARHAVKPGGWLMGHDFCPYAFPGVVRAVREFAVRWGCGIEVTSDDKLPSFAMRNPERSPLKSGLRGIIAQIGVGDRDGAMLDFAGPDIEAWAKRHGWQYLQLRENIAAPKEPVWSKLLLERRLYSDYDAILTLDADVMLADPAISPAAAFEAPGIGLVVTGQCNDGPHLNCGVRAVRTDHPLVLPMLTAGFNSYEKWRGHYWQEQAAIHELQLHFPDVCYPLSPRWNYNSKDRHLQGCVDPVMLGYHGEDHRLARMISDKPHFTHMP